jgi:predicted Zn finger-like uncharacterized protein
VQFVCDRCKTKYEIDEGRLRGKALKIRCRGCGNVMDIRDPNLGAPRPPAAPPARPPGKVATPAAPGKPPPTAPPRSGTLGEKFQRAFEARAPAAPPSDEVTHIMASPFVAPATTDEAADVARKLARWHVAIRNQPMGPMSEEAIRRHIENGEAGSDSLVWREGFDEWRPLSQVKDLGYLVELAETLARSRSSAAAPWRESVFDVPAGLQRGGDPVAAARASRLNAYLVNGIVAVVSFALGMMFMHLVRADPAAAPPAPHLTSAAAPDPAAEVEGSSGAGQTYQSGSLTFTLTNPSLVAEEDTRPPGEAAAGESAAAVATPTGGGRTGGTRTGGTRTGGTRADDGTAAASSGAATFPLGTLPARDLAPDSEGIRAGTVGGGTAGQAAGRPLSATQILPVIQAGQAGIQLCYNQARSRDFVADLDVRLTIEIAPSGSVRQARLTSSDYVPPNLENCIIGRVRGWQFPSASATSKVVLPFGFSSR